MKTTILILFTTLLAITGCSKTYICGCTDGSTNIIHTEETQANTQSEAQDNCRSLGIECDLM